MELSADEAVREDFVNLAFHPLTLVTLHGLGPRLNLHEASLVLALVELAANDDDYISCIRVTNHEQAKYASELLEHAIKPIIVNWEAARSFTIDRSWNWRELDDTMSWVGCTFERVEASRFSPILERSWRCGGGHWLFFSGSISNEIFEMQITAPTHLSDVLQLRARLFLSKGMSAISFDDTNVDVYSNKRLSDVEHWYWSLPSEARPKL